MLYGIHLSTQGARNQMTRLDVLANNLANSSTTGFKRDFAVFQTHLPYDKVNGGGDDPPGNLNDSTGGTSPASTHTDYSNGAIIQTGNPLDLSIQGPGFLRVQDGQSEFLTRNGRLNRGPTGQLVQSDTGFPVLTTAGTSVTIPSEAAEVEIDNAGGVFMLVDGQRSLLGELDLVSPQSVANLEKRANGLLAFKGPLQAATDTVVKQGTIEASGVKPIEELMDLVEASRAVETNINIMKMQDEMVGQLLQTALR